MSIFDIVILGVHKAIKGIVSWQGIIPVGNEDDDVESLGEAPVFQCLGVSSMAWPKDATGYAEGIGVRNCGGYDFVWLGARDTRSATIVGNLKPGDTVVHSTGPNQAAQLQLKEEKKQAVLVTKDSRNRTMALVLDGKTDMAGIFACGGCITFDENGDWSIVSSGGAAIKSQGSKVMILAELSLPGMEPGMALAQMYPVPPQLPGSGGSATTVLLKPVQATGK